MNDNIIPGMPDHVSPSISRRSLIASGIAAAAWIGSQDLGTVHAASDELVIDLTDDPKTLDPALAYTPQAWSVVHSIYDALVQYGPHWDLQPLVAETFTQAGPTTFAVKLRAGLTFHDGSPVTVAAIQRSLDHIRAVKSDVTDLFGVISKIDVIDDLTAHIVCKEPAPWLPAQMAVWLLLLPEAASKREVLAKAPIGSGPFTFDSYAPGDKISLTKNERYTWPSPKGAPLADKVTFRFVPESTTRVADLLSGSAGIVASVPFDQVKAVETDKTKAMITPLAGSAWIRIATDVPPFDDVRVRQALNYAIDVDKIIAALFDGQGQRLASFAPDKRILGWNPGLKPYSYDPDKAKSLLKEVGVSGSLSAVMDYASTERGDVAEVLAAQISAIGIQTTAKQTEITAFNSTWSDKSAPALRLTSWRYYDPSSLLDLVFASSGYLSRFKDPQADKLIHEADIEADAKQRAALYQQLSQVLYDDPPVVYLWNLTAVYGQLKSLEGWSPRADEYTIPTKGYGGTS